MRKRNSKFNQFIRKVEGKPDETLTIPTQERTRCSLGVGYGLLHQWLRREITTSKYIERVRSMLPSEERLLAYNERQRLNVSTLDVDSMGLYNGDRSAYQRSVEYITGYTESERQAIFSSVPDGWESVFDSGHYYVRSDATDIWYRYRREGEFAGEWQQDGPPPSVSRPREEPVRLSELRGDTIYGLPHDTPF